MNQTERKERINELADKTVAELNEKQKQMLDQFRKVSDTVANSKKDAKDRSIQEVVTTIFEVVKLYKAIESYNTILEEFKEGVGDMPYIKVLAEVLGVESKDIINIFANDAEPEVWNKLVQRLMFSFSLTRARCLKKKKTQVVKQRKMTKALKTALMFLLPSVRTRKAKTSLIN